MSATFTSSLRRRLPLGKEKHIYASRFRFLMVDAKWEPELSSDTVKKVETYWLRNLKHKTEKLHMQKKISKEKFYILSMFPYPSGRLHMGHVRVYTISDTIAHYHRMKGKEVLHPMGWDAFGLPAENAAIERNLRPDDWTYSNISYMRKQLKDLATTFNWEREVTTCSPEYYRWTQFIFLQLFRSGLAYQKEATVNWDPVDQTVLANEQVDEEGCSWRSGAKVQQKLLKQWFLKMTHFSKGLQDGLENLPDWPNSIKSMQRNWIGDCSGCLLDFKLKTSIPGVDPVLRVHTLHPDLIYGAAYIVLSPTHTLLKKPEFINQLDPIAQEKVLSDSNQLDINLNIYAENPFSGKMVPLLVSSFVQFEENVEMHVGIPSSSPDDLAFAERHQLHFENVLEKKESGQNLGFLVNSGKFSGMSREEAKDAVMQDAKDQGFGGQQTSPRQYDWLISRQRYWGTPIPIIHCNQCKVVPVPDDDLPVVLPKLDSLSSKGLSPLTEVKDWYNVRCPKCNNPAVRETDTMDTFVDSAWYFLRYTDANNSQEIFSKKEVDWLMPVDLYIGGKEHAILHLLYARFINHFLHEKGMVACKEPFKRLLVQGLVMGQSYKTVTTGKYLPKDEVDFSGSEPVSLSTGEKLEIKWDKMSKSKYNGVDPEESIAEYGVDTVRLFILSGIPPEHNMPWNVEAIPGVIRWKKRLWSLVTNFREVKSRWKNEVACGDMDKEETEIKKQLNYTIKEVSHQFEEDFMLSVAITRLMTFTNFLKGCSEDVVAESPVYEKALRNLCTMVAPMAPLMASEMWQGMNIGNDHQAVMSLNEDVFEQTWPTLEEEDTEEDVVHVMLTVKVNNKTVGTVKLQKELLANENQLKDFILETSVGKEHLKEHAIKRTIIASRVPLVNFLVESS
ncbi:leucine--tRNA ligase, mitochondrial-like isoform X1 [Apostichopus japonicus]|uniref:leucine--tRNA ligase, mitochondrial-like isoform X1 n=2 Tax=Stichopus japonicus TaxID=307972 RepID=UPI003AB11C07